MSQSDEMVHAGLVSAQHAIVVGGGFAGLTAAVALTDAGWRVTVIERRAMLGGRARSFTDPSTGDVVDNGQHLFLSGYTQTLRFLQRLDTLKCLRFQDRLTVAFAEPGRPLARLRCPRWPAPWHLAAGVIRFPLLSWHDKRALARVLPQVARLDDAQRAALDCMTVAEWLRALGQSPRARQVFWDPLTIAALNDQPETASALGLATVISRMFGQSERAGRLGMAEVGLSALYADPAAAVIRQGGGTVRANTAAVAVESSDTGPAVRLANGERLTAEAVIVTVPPSELGRMLPDGARTETAWSRLSAWPSSPIVSINLWLDRDLLEDTFVGCIGTRVQWIFRRPNRRLALLISAAGALADAPNDLVIAAAVEDLGRCLPAARSARLLKAQVVREPQATVALPVGSDAWRPGPATAWPNLYIAGDWTATGWPATIESAVVSGYVAAEKVLASADSPL